MSRSLRLPETEIVGQRVLVLRRQRRLRQKELTFAAGIPHERICRLEAGRIDPRLSELVRIAAVLNVEVGALFEDRRAA